MVFFYYFRSCVITHMDRHYFSGCFEDKEGAWSTTASSETSRSPSGTCEPPTLATAPHINSILRTPPEPMAFCMPYATADSVVVAHRGHLVIARNGKVAKGYAKKILFAWKVIGDDIWWC